MVPGRRVCLLALKMLGGLAAAVTRWVLSRTNQYNDTRIHKVFIGRNHQISCSEEGDSLKALDVYAEPV